LDVSIPNQFTERIVYAAPVAVTICALFVCSQGEVAVGFTVGVGAGAAAVGRVVRTGAGKCRAGALGATGRTKCWPALSAELTLLAELPTAKEPGATASVAASAQTVASPAVAHRRPVGDRRRIACLEPACLEPACLEPACLEPAVERAINPS
jgi:hypothetical protein